MLAKSAIQPIKIACPHHYFAHRRIRNYKLTWPKINCTICKALSDTFDSMATILSFESIKSTLFGAAN